MYELNNLIYGMLTLFRTLTLITEAILQSSLSVG
jgi:hypothetical protein